MMERQQIKQIFGIVCVVEDLKEATENWSCLLYTSLFSMVSSFDYAVLPMFILMATIITETGMGTSLYSSCRTWLGHLPGGLCITSIIACAVFALSLIHI